MIADLKHITGRAYSSFHPIRATYDMTLSILGAHIHGDFVECGVAAGAQVAAMAKAMEDFGEFRRIHLFDSFCGIPKGGEFDNDIRPLVGQSSKLETSGVTACSVGQVQHHMSEWGVPGHILTYHVGWFQNTVPTFKEKIALLRLDGDLYESTKVCLEHLMPRLSVGGWCIVDDFALDGCRKAVMEHLSPAPIYFQKHQ